MFVASDGNVMMCNSDEYGDEIIGNALTEKIYDIWHGEKFNRIRNNLLESNLIYRRLDKI